MKKVFLSLAVVAVLTVVSCKKEVEATPAADTTTVVADTTVAPVADTTVADTTVAPAADTTVAK